MAISLAALQGACIMNNTFCLAIFMFLIYIQGLAWEFFAETLTILFIQVAVALLALKRVHTLQDGYLILALYPVSIVMVILLTKIGWN